MIVTIAGCGALGSLLAARLIEGGVRVQAFQRKGEQLSALKQNGITIKGDRTGTTTNFKLAAVSDNPHELDPCRLIIVLVKSYSTTEVYPVKTLLEHNGMVLTLQNGLGNAEILASMFGEANVAAGVDTYGAFRISPGVIGWGGDGHIILGSWRKETDVSWIGDLLRDAGLNATCVEDPKPAIWNKLAINVMVNTTSALTRMNNAEMLANSFVMELMKKLGQETVEAAGRAGIQMDFEALWAMHLENLKRTAANKPSMLQDVESKRQTEVDAIPGGVLKYSLSKDEFPYTRTVYALLKAMDTHKGF